MTLQDLPTLNACLNALSAALALYGYLLIRRGRREAHRAAMLGALLCSTMFLASYLYYHFHVGSVRYAGQGTLRTLYLAVLLSHTVLAVVILPLIAVTLGHALRARFSRHRLLARWTLPLWSYVSVTGVVVYLMLYRL